MIKNSNYILKNEDVFEGLKHLEDDSCDVCIVDPPYGASSTKNWSYGSDNKIKGFGGDWKLTSEAWDLLSQNDSFLSTLQWLKELKRIINNTNYYELSQDEKAFLDFYIRYDNFTYTVYHIHVFL